MKLKDWSRVILCGIVWATGSFSLLQWVIKPIFFVKVVGVVFFTFIGAGLGYVDIPIKKYDVLGALSLTTWKGLTEIKHALHLAKGVHPKSMRTVNVARLETYLSGFVARGFVERKGQLQSPAMSEYVYEKNTESQFEYRLTPKGIR